jgi:FAD/FMN-containing dehydrogenase
VHGLAPITGSSPTVGVVGLLLGGGLGPLARSHGFSSDYLVAVDVVTGAGDRLRVSATEHPELFWALRGGKVGLGVVTSVEIRLVPLPSLYAGSLFFDEGQIEAALRGWLAWTASADVRVTTSVAIVRFPPLDRLPPPLRGRRLLSLRFAFPGSEEEGKQLAAPLRAFGKVYLDYLGPLPAAEVARIHSDPTDPVPSWTTGMLLSRTDQDFASVLLSHFGPGTDAPFVAAEVRHIGQAARRDVGEGSAVGGRTAEFTLSLVSSNPARFAAAPAAVDRLRDQLQPWLSPETNINFGTWPPTPGHRSRAWPATTLARLNEVRRKYDPSGLMPFD